MATARERLLQALSAIIEQRYSEDSSLALRRLLRSYRVQAKPGADIDVDNSTARDVLFNKIVQVWQKQDSMEKSDLTQLLAQFRMQLKQGLKRSVKDEQNDAPLDSNSPPDLNSLKGANKFKRPPIAHHENAYFKDKTSSGNKNVGPTKVAGGPRKKTSKRGQCPKCRSMGIVLAKAYGGEDHYSCIYCGYHAYLKEFDPKLDLPLAAELLGDAFLTPDLDSDD